MLFSSAQELQRYAAELAKTHTHILLTWDLGAGKTTFSQGFAEWLGISKDDVQSPTYTYLHIYNKKLLHIDMYRISDQYQLLNIELPELIDTHPYVLIERPKFTELYADYPRLQVHISKLWENSREMVCTPAILDHV